MPMGQKKEKEMENKQREQNRKDFIIEASLEFARIRYKEADNKMAVADIADNSVSMGIALANSLQSSEGESVWDT